MPQLVLHLAYANTFFGYEWLNPSFWTLAIELRYYLLIGLLFPWVANRRRTLVFDFLGKISYSLYLLHWPIGHFAGHVSGLAPAG